MANTTYSHTIRVLACAVVFHTGCISGGAAPSPESAGPTAPQQASAPAQTPPLDTEEPPSPCAAPTLDPPWILDADGWRLEPEIRFDIESTELTLASERAIDEALGAVPTSFGMEALVVVHPDVAAAHAERGRDLSAVRARALAERLIEARGAGTGRVVPDPEAEPHGHPRIRFRVFCPDAPAGPLR